MNDNHIWHHIGHRVCAIFVATVCYMVFSIQSWLTYIFHELMHELIDGWVLVGQLTEDTLWVHDQLSSLETREKSLSRQYSTS